MRQIARDLGLSRPPTPLEIAERIYATRNLTTPPGSSYSYSNFGYLVAMAVVERVSGLAFIDFVRQRLLAPLGVTDVAPCPTAGPNGRPADQVQPEDDGLGLTTLRPGDNTTVPAVYSGDGMAKESALGPCGLAASATALVRTIGSHAVWAWAAGRRAPVRQHAGLPLGGGVADRWGRFRVHHQYAGRHRRWCMERLHRSARCLARRLARDVPAAEGNWTIPKKPARKVGKKLRRQSR